MEIDKIESNGPMTHPNERAFGSRMHDGLTKREYFVAIAMQGLCANSKMLNTVTLRDVENLPSMAIALADSIIDQLNGETS